MASRNNERTRQVPLRHREDNWYLVCYEDDEILRVLHQDNIEHVLTEDDEDVQVGDIVRALWLPTGEYFEAKVVAMGTNKNDLMKARLQLEKAAKNKKMEKTAEAKARRAPKKQEQQEKATDPKATQAATAAKKVADKGKKELDKEQQAKQRKREENKKRKEEEREQQQHLQEARKAQAAARWRQQQLELSTITEAPPPTSTPPSVPCPILIPPPAPLPTSTPPPAAIPTLTLPPAGTTVPIRTLLPTTSTPKRPCPTRGMPASKRGAHFYSCLDEIERSSDEEMDLSSPTPENSCCRELHSDNQALRRRLQKLHKRLAIALKAKTSDEVISLRPAPGVIDPALAAAYQMKEVIDGSGVYWFSHQKAYCNAFGTWAAFINAAIDFFFTREVLAKSSAMGDKKRSKTKGDHEPLNQVIVMALIGKTCAKFANEKPVPPTPAAVNRKINMKCVEARRGKRVRVQVQPDTSSSQPPADTATCSTSSQSGTDSSGSSFTLDTE